MQRMVERLHGRPPHDIDTVGPSMGFSAAIQHIQLLQCWTVSDPIKQRIHIVTDQVTLPCQVSAKKTKQQKTSTKQQNSHSSQIIIIKKTGVGYD